MSDFTGRQWKRKGGVLRSDLYTRRYKSWNSTSIRWNNVGLVLDWNRSRDRNTSGSDRNSRSGCNASLREKSNAIDGNDTIIAWDVGVKIGASACVANFRLVVLWLCHGEVLRGVLQLKVIETN